MLFRYFEFTHLPILNLLMINLIFECRQKNAHLEVHLEYY